MTKENQLKNSGASTAVAIDPAIFELEVVRLLNSQSTFGNRDAESRALVAFRIAVVRTRLGQRVPEENRPTLHLSAAHSAGDFTPQLHTGEHKYVPHIIDIVCAPDIRQRLQDAEDALASWYRPRYAARSLVLKTLVGIAANFAQNPPEIWNGIGERQKDPRCYQEGEALELVLELFQQMKEYPRQKGGEPWIPSP